MSSAGKKNKAAAPLDAPPAKKAKGGAPASLPPAALNPALAAPEAIKALHAQFKATRPFPYMHLHNVFPDALLQEVRRELLSPSCAYTPKANDLYQFEQTDALRKVAKDSATAKLREFIYSSPFRAWMEGITGIPTNDTLDISAAKYTEGSYLLCHDDDLAERRIAYIIYLVPEDWEAEDGGALDIFNCTPGPDGTGDGCAGGPSIVPSTVVASLTPVWNSIAFFEVSAWSHHQVAEVLNATKGPRLSISGWFHGPPVPRPEVKLLPAPRIQRWCSPTDPEASFDLTDDIAEGLLAAGASQASLAEAFGDEDVAEELGQLLPRPATTTKSVSGASGVVQGCAVVPCSAPDALEDWIAPSYLKESTLAAMARHLRANGSLELKDFLREDKYLAVMKALGTQKWTHIGPPNLQSFKVALDTDEPEALAAATSAGASRGLTPDVVARLFSFMTGPIFGTFVQQLSGLALGGVSGRVRCFAGGDYSMVCDPDYKESQREAKAARVLGGKAAAAKGDKAATAGAGSDADAPVVDVLLRCVVEEEWAASAGGCVTYLTYDEELLTADVKQNALSIVLRGPGTMSFVKLVSQKAEENLYDVALSYYPPADDDEEGEESE